MKGAKPKLPPQAEWDFRQTADSLIEIVVLYEYARTHGAFREPLTRWLRQRVDGKALAAHLLDALRKGDDKRHRKLKAAHPVTDLPRSMRTWELVELIANHRPDFPAPFFAYSKSPLTVARNPRFSRIRARSFIREAVQAKAIFDEDKTAGRYSDFGQYLHVLHDDDFAVTIKWDGATVDEIVSDFSRWLHIEAKNHKERMKPRGHRGKAPAEKLKWLAALRLRNAGFTFEAAQAALRKFDDSNGLKGSAQKFLPLYADASGWSDALRGAENELSKLASNPP